MRAKLGKMEIGWHLLSLIKVKNHRPIFDIDIDEATKSKLNVIEWIGIDEKLSIEIGLGAIMDP